MSTTFRISDASLNIMTMVVWSTFRQSWIHRYAVQEGERNQKAHAHRSWLCLCTLETTFHVDVATARECHPIDGYTHQLPQRSYIWLLWLKIAPIEEGLVDLRPIRWAAVPTPCLSFVVSAHIWFIIAAWSILRFSTLFQRIGAPMSEFSTTTSPSLKLIYSV